MASEQGVGVWQLLGLRAGTTSLCLEHFAGKWGKVTSWEGFPTPHPPLSHFRGVPSCKNSLVPRVMPRGKSWNSHGWKGLCVVRAGTGRGDSGDLSSEVIQGQGGGDPRMLLRCLGSVEALEGLLEHSPEQ